MKTTKKKDKCSVKVTLNRCKWFSVNAFEFITHQATEQFTWNAPKSQNTKHTLSLSLQFKWDFLGVIVLCYSTQIYSKCDEKKRVCCDDEQWNRKTWKIYAQQSNRIEFRIVGSNGFSILINDLLRMVRVVKSRNIENRIDRLHILVPIFYL